MPHTHARFFASGAPAEVMPILISALKSLRVIADDVPDVNPGTVRERFRARMGGCDGREQLFKGWMEVEGFCSDGKGSFILTRREQVSAQHSHRRSGLSDEHQGDPLS